LIKCDDEVDAGRTTGEPLIQQLAVPCEQTVDEASHDAVVSATFAESDTLPDDDFMNGDTFDVVVRGLMFTLVCRLTA
jgi:hypothetical protein